MVEENSGHRATTALISDDIPGAEIHVDILVASHPVLPTNAVVEYLNEGAANIVYKISVQDCYDKPKNLHRNAFQKAEYRPEDLGFWEGSLLRLRKELPWTAPCAIAQAKFLLNIYPLFNSHHLIEQQLVQVKSAGIIQKLNHGLKDWEKIPHDHEESCKAPRPSKFQGKYLADDEHGLLIQDMTPLLTSKTCLIEFKPKWLTQSRSAPEFSKRCRTCAKRARTNAENVKSDKPLLNFFCPLDLVSKDETALNRVARAILTIQNPILSKDFKQVHQMSQWARSSPLLTRLATLQSKLDSAGVFDTDLTDGRFLTAMTLRDCSLYLHVPSACLSAPIVSKIGDLDLKRPEKAEYWKAVERSLLQEGWYLGTEKVEDRQPLDCNLFPDYWTPSSFKAALQPKRWSDPITEEDA